MFRGGLAYDQSPVQDADRTVRLPDSDRTWLSFGAQYKMDSHWKFDLGGTYIWVKDGSINNPGNDPTTNTPNPAAYGLVNGNYSNNVVIVSGQVTYSF
jgi:long-chain fatty acid transport protein